MSIHSLRNITNWALMVALVLGAGAIAQAQNAIEAKGKVVQIGRADSDPAKPNLPPPDDGDENQTFAPQTQQQMPKYWVGLMGGSITPDNPLRAHLDLPADQGLLVQNVAPNSPAAKAGLKQFDILLKANDKELRDMSDLSELVMAEGPTSGKISLEVLRHNKMEKMSLTPEERPANDAGLQSWLGSNLGNGVAFGGGQALPNDLLQQFGGGNNQPFQFRNFGNGVIVGGGNGAGVANVPNGVSITIQKQNDKPANITVKRGEETWNVVGDDPASLKQLPEDLRPAVEQMLHNNGGMHIQMPNFEHQLNGRGNGQGIDDSRFRDRLERMEQRLEEMQRRLGGDNHATTEKPSDEHEEQK